MTHSTLPGAAATATAAGPAARAGGATAVGPGGGAPGGRRRGDRGRGARRLRRQLLVQEGGQRLEAAVLRHHLAEGHLHAEGLLELLGDLRQRQRVETELQEARAAVGGGDLDTRDLLEQAGELADESLLACGGGGGGGGHRALQLGDGPDHRGGLGDGRRGGGLRRGRGGRRAHGVDPVALRLEGVAGKGHAPAAAAGRGAAPRPASRPPARAGRRRRAARPTRSAGTRRARRSRSGGPCRGPAGGPGWTGWRAGRPPAGGRRRPRAASRGPRGSAPSRAGAGPSSPGRRPLRGEIHLPVAVETNGMRGRPGRAARTSSVNGGTTGSIMGEWKACDVCRRRQASPSPSRTACRRSTSASGPATTHRLGPLSDASARPPPRRGSSSSRGQPHGEHGALGLGLHEPAALADQARGLGQLEHAGQRGRHELAHAVPDQGDGRQAPVHPQPRQGVLEGEQRRLRDRRGAQAAPRPRLRRAFVGEHQLAQVAAEHRPEGLRAGVEGLAEDRLRLVQGPAHADVLGALAGEHEGHAAGLLARRAAHQAPRVGQRGQRVGRVARHHEAPAGEGPAADLQGVGHVGQGRAPGGARGAGGQARRPRRGAPGRAGREQHELLRVLGSAGLGLAAAPPRPRGRWCRRPRRSSRPRAAACRPGPVAAAASRRRTGCARSRSRGSGAWKCRLAGMRRGAAPARS